MLEPIHKRRIRLYNLHGHVLTMYARGWGIERRRRFLFLRESDRSLRARVAERMKVYV